MAQLLDVILPKFIFVEIIVQFSIFYPLRAFLVILDIPAGFQGRPKYHPNKL